LVVLDDVLEIAGSSPKRVNKNQPSLFQEEPADFVRILANAPAVTPFSEKEILEKERELLGLYLSGHPLDRYHAEIERVVTHRLEELAECRDREQVVVAGWLTGIKMIQTKKNEPMAFLSVEDKSGQLEVVVFPKLFARVRFLLKEDRPILIKGTVDVQDEGLKLIADQLQDLSVLPKEPKRQAGELTAIEAYIRISPQNETPDTLSRLKEILLHHRGSVPVYLYYERTKRVLALPPAQYGLSPTRACIGQVERLLGSGSVRIKETK
jgi:DNA polymerase-3 subunit alpha